MKEVTKVKAVKAYETFDGKVFETKEEALRHANERAGQIESLLSRELIKMDGNAAEICMFIYDNREDFRLLLAAYDDSEFRTEEKIGD